MVSFEWDKIKKKGKKYDLIKTMYEEPGMNANFYEIRNKKTSYPYKNMLYGTQKEALKDFFKAEGIIKKKKRR